MYPEEKLEKFIPCLAGPDSFYLERNHMDLESDLRYALQVFYVSAKRKLHQMETCLGQILAVNNSLALLIVCILVCECFVRFTGI